MRIRSVMLLALTCFLFLAPVVPLGSVTFHYGASARTYVTWGAVSVLASYGVSNFITGGTFTVGLVDSSCPGNNTMLSLVGWGQSYLLPCIPVSAE